MGGAPRLAELRRKTPAALRAFVLSEVIGLGVLCWAATFAVLGLGAILVVAPASPVLLLAARLCAAVGGLLALLGLAG